jgi:hypothetical protein
VTGPNAGRYRVFADFKRGGKNITLARDLTVGDRMRMRALPAPASDARTLTGYEVRLTAADFRAGHEARVGFDVLRDGRSVEVEPYLGAGGHLVALRKGDMAFLHVHPTEHAGNGVSFMTTFPTAGTYRLFLQFKHDDRVHTAPFTIKVGA